MKSVAEIPVNLGNKKKLVYSAHVYGPSDLTFPYFQNSTFPSNMPNIWDDHFGFVPSMTGNHYYALFMNYVIISDNVCPFLDPN